MKNLPARACVSSWPGDAEFIAELDAGFAFAIFTGILLMYAVLVLLFRSFFLPDHHSWPPCPCRSAAPSWPC
jgi:HAE1 family hydrophobic/amphiphilic exporter-1